MTYFTIPNLAIALNPKVGSSAVSRAIIAAYYPDIERSIVGASYPAGKGPNTTRWHPLVPKIASPDKPVVLLVRNPVERFASAMVQIGLTDVDETIDMIRTKAPHPRERRREQCPTLYDDEHFRPQYRLIYNETHLFRFPDHLEQFATFCGLTLPLPTINEARTEKPTITDRQAATIRDFYSEDQKLYDSITNPDTIVNLPPWQPLPDGTPESIGELKQLVAETRWKRRITPIAVGTQLISTRIEEDGEWLARKIHAQSSEALEAYPYKPHGGDPALLSAALAVRAAQCREWYINACFAVEAQFVALTQFVPLGQLASDVRDPSAWPQTQFAESA